MKLRSTRDVYWLDVRERATIVIENTTPATVIIELATTPNSPREPSAPAPNNSGSWFIQSPSMWTSTSISTKANSTLAATMIVGRNQKLSRAVPPMLQL